MHRWDRRDFGDMKVYKVCKSLVEWKSFTNFKYFWKVFQEKKSKLRRVLRTLCRFAPATAAMPHAGVMAEDLQLSMWGYGSHGMCKKGLSITEKFKNHQLLIMGPRRPTSPARHPRRLYWTQVASLQLRPRYPSRLGIPVLQSGALPKPYQITRNA